MDKKYFRVKMEELQALLSAKYGRKVKILWSWEGGEDLESDWEAWYINPISGHPSEPVRCISGIHALEKLLEREKALWPPKPVSGVYSCDNGCPNFDAEIPPQTGTNQDVACPKCHMVETSLSHDTPPRAGRK